MDQIKLLLFVTQLERAGVQTVAFMQARYFHNQGYSITLCFLYDKYNLLNEFKKNEAFSIVNLEAKVPGESRFKNTFYILRGLWRFYRLLHREKFHVIETMTPYGNIIGTIMAWMAKVPVRISSQHNRLVHYPRWVSRVNSYLVNSSITDITIAVSDHIRNYCVSEGMFPHKILTIHNGVDIDAFRKRQLSLDQLTVFRSSLGIAHNTVILTTVARLHPQKGHKYLVQAIAKIRKVYSNFVCLFVGDGEIRFHLSQYVKQLNLENFIRILGMREDVPRILAISDIFVLPSLHEGMPMVVLEAMAAQLPVIATAVDGTNEIVLNNETGLLVPPADPEALCQAIVTLLIDSDLRCKMGKRGYEFVKEHFSELTMCRKYEEIMHAILSHKVIKG